MEETGTTQPAGEARGELEVLAEKIAGEVGKSEAPRDSALTTLAKGMSDALQALIKGKRSSTEIDDKPPKTDEEIDQEGKKDTKIAALNKADKADTDDDDEENEDEDKDKGKPSYEDMKMGAEGGDEFLDATEFLVAMAADLRAMRKANEALTDEVKSLTAKVEELDTASRKDVGLVLDQMAKGVIGVHELLRNTPIVPASAVMSSMQAKYRVIRENLDKAVETTGCSVEQMFKALQTKLIDEDQYRALKAGQLEDAELLNKIRAL
jgi:hypothetical protein